MDCLTALGHRVIAPKPPSHWHHGYLNGDANFRVNAIKNALLNQENDVVWIARGGYGLTPLLPQLKNELTTLRDCPKVIGFSDVTALHCFLLSQQNITSFHGPLATTLANENNDTVDAILDWLNGTTTETAYLNLKLCQPNTKKHLFEGRLWGGNLTVLGHLAGAGYYLRCLYFVS